MSDPSPAGRGLAARRYNERVKLGASFLNTLAVGTLGAAVIVPSFSPTINQALSQLELGFSWA